MYSELSPSASTRRACYFALADAARCAAQTAADMQTFREHMHRAREFEWLAVTEPYADAGSSASAAGQRA